MWGSPGRREAPRGLIIPKDGRHAGPRGGGPVRIHWSRARPLAVQGTSSRTAGGALGLLTSGSSDVDALGDVRGDEVGVGEQARRVALLDGFADALECFLEGEEVLVDVK